MDQRRIGEYAHDVGAGEIVGNSDLKCFENVGIARRDGIGGVHFGVNL